MGQGRDEQVIDLVSKKLVGYKFKRHVMPASRAVKALGRSNQVFCMASLYRNQEREQFISFTEQYSTLGLSPAIAISKSLVEKLGLSNTYGASLQSLILKHGLTVGSTLNRSYGKEIDTVLKAAPAEQLSMRAGRDSLESLTYMLLKGRVDIILGYPSEHAYLSKLMDANNELTQLSVQEAKAVATGYIGCSKNPQGDIAIKAIDEALAKLNHSKQFTTVMLRWLPQHMAPTLKPYLKEY